MDIQVKELEIPGMLELRTSTFSDHRGSFEINWEKNLWPEHIAGFEPLNAYHSYNSKMGTVRGMHYQEQPFQQAKLVSCVRGKSFDVAVDLRKDSPAYLKWIGIELSEKSGISVFIPEGMAHGFMTLEDHTTIFYLISGDYVPSSSRTLNWSDPSVAIEWPDLEVTLSEGDKMAPFAT